MIFPNSWGCILLTCFWKKVNFNMWKMALSIKKDLLCSSYLNKTFHFFYRWCLVHQKAAHESCSSFYNCLQFHCLFLHFSQKQPPLPVLFCLQGTTEVCLGQLHPWLLLCKDWAEVTRHTWAGTQSTARHSQLWTLCPANSTTQQGLCSPLSFRCSLRVILP